MHEPSIRILLVGDNATRRCRIRDLLDAFPCDVESTEDLAGADALLREERFDCVMVQSRLRDAGTRALFGSFKDAPWDETAIVVLLGEGDGGMEAAAMEAGADDTVHAESLDAPLLMKSIRLAIEKRRAQELHTRLKHTDRLSSLGKLAAGVAHELNNPAAYVLVNLQLLGEHLERGIGPDDAPRGEEPQERTTDAPTTSLEECRQLVADSLHGIRQITGIVRDLGSFSRLEQPENQSTCLNEACSQGCRRSVTASV